MDPEEQARRRAYIEEVRDELRDLDVYFEHVLTTRELLWREDPIEKWRREMDEFWAARAAEHERERQQQQAAEAEELRILQERQWAKAPRTVRDRFGLPRLPPVIFKIWKR